MSKIQKSLIAFLALAVCSSFILAGCSGNKEASGSKDKKTVIKLAHACSTDHPFHIGVDTFAKSVASKTNGKVEVQIFPNGQLGSDERQLAESLQLGNIHATIVAGGALASFTPKIDVFNLPFIFKDLPHLYRASDGEPGQMVAKDLEAKGLKVLAWFNGQPRSIINSKKPINSLEDLKGMKIRIMQSPVQIATFNALGALATPMAAGEVYSAIQQGVVDGAENHPFSIRSYKWYEVAPYYSLTNHFYEACPLLMDSNTFNSLSPELQKAVLEAAAEGRDAMRKYMEKEFEDDHKDLGTKGVKVNKVENIEPFRQAVEPVYKQFEGKIGKEIIEKAKSM